MILNNNLDKSLVGSNNSINISENYESHTIINHSIIYIIDHSSNVKNDKVIEHTCFKCPSSFKLIVYDEESSLNKS